MGQYDSGLAGVRECRQMRQSKFLSMIGSTCLILFTLDSIFADDVYNFYFQKAPGPVTVNQGTSANSAPSPQVVPPTPATTSLSNTPNPTALTSLETAPTSTTLAPQPATLSAVAKLPELTPQKPSDYKWQVFLGSALVSEHGPEFYGLNWPRQRYSGVAIGGKYSFSRYFGLDGGIVTRTGSEGGRIDYTNFNLGASVTPIHLQLFGFEMFEFSFLAGVLTTTDYMGVEGRFSRTLRTYTGVETTINLSNRFAFTSRYKMFDETKYGHGMFGLTYRF